MSMLHECKELILRIEGMRLRFRVDLIDALATAVALGDAYERLDAEDKKLLPELISESVSANLVNLAWISAEESLNSNDPAWLRLALIINIVEGFKIDFRDNYFVLRILDHVAWRIGVRMCDIVKSIDPAISPKVIGILERFFQESLGARALEFAKMKEVEVNGRVRFRMLSLK